MDNFIFQIRDLKSSDFKGDSIKSLDLDLNLDVRANEVHALISDNDSITKKLMEIILGQVKNVEGKVIFKNKNFDVSEISKIDSISFLSQNSMLIENLSIAENIALKSFPKRRFLPFINWKKVNKEAKELLEKLNFPVNYRIKVSRLSNEEKKLVNIAIAFSSNPELIIMYNPTEGLSSKSVQKLYQIIDKYKMDGKSIIYITKLWEEALKASDRISIMLDGKIKKTIMTEDAIKNPQQLLNILGRHNYRSSEVNVYHENEEVLNAVFKAAEFLTSEYELNDVLLLLSKQVTKFMNADECITYLIDEGTNTIIDTLEFKVKEELEGKLKKEFILNIAEKKKIYYSNKHEKDFFSIFELNNKVKTIICIPILIRSRVTGVIQICYESLYTHSKDETKYLSTFARHAALAIEDTRLMGRSALLQESHHRIKNNLQSIISIISLQKQVKDDDIQDKLNDILDSIISRVKSIAAIHDLLAKDKLGRSIINIKDIVEIIADFFRGMNSELKIKLELDDIFIPYNKATSIALIINELISNCVKHAFPNGGTGFISVKCKRLKEIILLSVYDNGVGISHNFNIDKVDSLGVSIVSSIIRYEFKGNIEFIAKEKGTEVKIELPNEKVFVVYNKNLNSNE